MSMNSYDDDWAEPPRSRRRQHADDDYEDAAYYRKPPHSGLGIASCIVGGCALLFGILFVVVAGVMWDASEPGGMDEDSPQVMVIGSLLLADLVLALVGLVLGIVGAGTGRRNKLFAGLGIGLNGLIFLGILCLMIVGAIMS